MSFEASVPEAVSLFKEVKDRPAKAFAMVRPDVREVFGKHLTETMRDVPLSLNQEAHKRSCQAVVPFIVLQDATVW